MNVFDEFRQNMTRRHFFAKGSSLLGTAAMASLLGHGSAQAAESGEAPIIHDVYFSLKDKSEASSKKMVEACKKYLAPQPGVTYFAVGVLAADLKRSVNDLDWDIGLHVVLTR